jgi:DHA2 family methylenomycin A resistance protein-like MFS transporter
VSVRRDRTRTAVVGTVLLAVFFAMLDLSIVNVALPTIRAELSTTYSGMQWIANSYTLAFASVLLIGGTIVDRISHRSALLISLSIFTAGALLCAAASNLALLLFGRLTQGFGAAILVPCSLALIFSNFSDIQERAKVIGAWSAINAIAVTVGPMTGGALVTWLNWRSVFALNIPIGVIAIALVLHFLPKVQTRRTQRSVSPIGLLLTAASSFLFAFAVTRGSEKEWNSPAVVLPLILAVASTGTFVVHNMRTPSPVLPRELLEKPVFRRCLIVVSCVGFSFSSALFLVAVQFQMLRDFSPVDAGLALTPIAVTMGITSLLIKTDTQQVWESPAHNLRLAQRSDRTPQPLPHSQRTPLCLSGPISNSLGPFNGIDASNCKQL